MKKIIGLAVFALGLQQTAHASQTITCRGQDTQLGKIKLVLEFLTQDFTWNVEHRRECVSSAGDGGQDGNWDCYEYEEYDELQGRGKMIQTVFVDDQQIAISNTGFYVNSNSRGKMSPIGGNLAMEVDGPHNYLLRPYYKGLTPNPQNEVKISNGNQLTVLNGVEPFRVIQLDCR